MRKLHLLLAGLLVPVGHGQTPQAPPPAPVATVRSVPLPGRIARPDGGAPVLWDIGQPADDEQLLLERINRARANPSAEADLLAQVDDPSILQAYSFFLVDLARFKADMALFPPLPPLAPSGQLTVAARRHSQWMLDNAVQAHVEGTLQPFDRVSATGYPWSIVGENIYAFAEGAEYAHASFEVDWGLLDALGHPISPGMQNPPGHRLNNHDPRYREAGVGLVTGTHTLANTTVGPKLFTIDFSDRTSPVPFVTGVIYFDLNSNGAYDLGEGIGGVRVEVSDSAYFGQTPKSGGYAIPTAEGPHAVTFSAPGLTPVTRSVTVSGGGNVKADLPLPYPAPNLNGPTAPGVGRTSQYQPSAVPAASAFNWVASRRQAFNTPLGAEPGQTGVDLSTSPGYDVVQNFRHDTGANSYRLTHPVGNDQILRLTSHLGGGSNPVLRFAAAFGFATPQQVLTAEVSTDDGTTWDAVWSKSGHGNPPDAAFTVQTVPLAGLAQREFQVRFRFRVLPGGAYYNTLNSGEGVYLDTITFDDVFELSDVGGGQVAATTTVPFVPPEVGEFLLGVQPVVGTRAFPWGPKLLVTAILAPDPTVVHLAAPIFGAGGKVRFDFQLVGGKTNGLVLERTLSLGTAWQTDPAAVLGTTPGGVFTFRTVPAGAAAYYQVRQQ